MLKTAICDLLGIRYPIIQGGMAHIATAELASAVSNAGGLGIIACANYEPDWVRRQIHSTRERTDKPFGVNIIMISPYVKQIVEVVIAERVNVVTTGAGNPAPFISRLKQAGIKVIPVIPSVALAQRVERVGADAVVAQGKESGGHVGETATMPLVPQVVDAVRIPVIAAGGIADGRGLVAALALGAQAVQMGTRFVCSEECIAHPLYKQKILEADDRSTVVTRGTMGHPARSLSNKLTAQLLEMEKKGVDTEEIDLVGRGKVYPGIVQGDVEWGSLLAGQISGMIKDIKPVKAIIEDMMEEAEEIIANLDSLRGEN